MLFLWFFPTFCSLFQNNSTLDKIQGFFLAIIWQSFICFWQNSCFFFRQPLTITVCLSRSFNKIRTFFPILMSFSRFFDKIHTFSPILMCFSPFFFFDEIQVFFSKSQQQFFFTKLVIWKKVKHWIFLGSTKSYKITFWRKFREKHFFGADMRSNSIFV